MFQRLLVLVQVVSVLLFGAVVGAHAAPANELRLAPGAQLAYPMRGPVRRIAIGDPEVAAVTLTGPSGVLITGKRVGTTTLFVWDQLEAARPAFSATVVVAPTLKVEGVTAEVAGSHPVLEGAVASLDAHQAALKTLTPGAEPVDRTTTQFDTQVQIDIKVVEVSRRRLMESGFFLGRNSPGNGRTAAISGPGNVNGLEASGTSFALSTASGFLPFSNAFNLVLGKGSNGVLSALSVLESNGFAYTLAEPSLTALSGHSATFLAGGEIPIPISSGTDGSTSIEYKEYGIKVALTPTVLEQNRIFLKVSPEVSEPDFGLAVQSGGVSVPGLSVRRTDTSVALADGESFVLSGLVSRNTASNVDKFPFLGELPIIGAFLRSTRFDRTDKELLMVVTAHLVRPFAKDQPLPPLPGAELGAYSPSFGEMMFEEKGRFKGLTGFSD
ncbi:Type II and III secretion system protein [Thauera humireducens]|uniref:type II and III secretion system protein family protein n=1 Tax=Thauera humireducens TaxID=1134435 RepID=UPI002467AA5E|nr:type II and III secretion system protein family protein [Thauera humireducens]CAH1746302.1 Type II and III secretion system protein [Thauera humireducens]